MCQLATVINRVVTVGKIVTSNRESRDLTKKDEDLPMSLSPDIDKRGDVSYRLLFPIHASCSFRKERLRNIVTSIIHLMLCLTMADLQRKPSNTCSLIESGR